MTNEDPRPAVPDNTYDDAREDLRATADAVLARLVGARAGEARLREDQWRAIEALVADKRRALVVQRTGWGKSAVYFLATALLREQGSGPTVIVSPLLALMRNQISAAARAGIQAATMNSANPQEWEQVQASVLRIGAILLVIGLLHGVNIVLMPVLGRLFSLNRKLSAEQRDPDPLRYP